MNTILKRILFKLLHRFVPTHTANSVLEVDLSFFAKQGKKLILIDIDNTLLAWSSRQIPQAVLQWIELGKNLGLQFCLISNTLNKERLSELSRQMSIQFVKGRFKPSRQMFLQALNRFHTDPSKALMIGDQLFTDILGASRMKIESIWVEPAAEKEFIGTKVNRIAEKMVCKGITWSSNQEKKTNPKSKSNAIHQFLKFALIGITSTVIDLGLHYLLMFKLTWNGQLLSNFVGTKIIELLSPITSLTKGSALDASFGFFKFFTVSLAILNGFYWNRRWTFQIKNRESKKQQFAKFTAIALIGLFLNTFIATAIYRPESANTKLSWLFASVIACTIVGFWNFFGQKLWVFQQKMS